MISILRRVRGRASPDSPWTSGKPVREELFSAERLEEHARSLAVAQTVTPRPARGHPLAGRLADNGAVLLHAYRMIAQSAEAGRAITPAAEWLVDNYYLVERQIREIRAGIATRLLSAAAEAARRPVRRISARVRPRLGVRRPYRQPLRPDMLCRFVRAYQEVQPLTIGELWAVAITLRIVLIENLRRLAEQIMHSSAARQEADGLADRLLGAGGHAAEPASIVLARATARRCPRRSPSSSCSGCATRIPGSRPR